MVIVNFSHSLSLEQIDWLEQQVGKKAERVISVLLRETPDSTAEMAKIATEMVNRAGLSPQEWQSLPILIVLPDNVPLAAFLVAELHGRMGYFPVCVYFQAANNIPSSCESIVVMNLQEQRNSARTRR